MRQSGALLIIRPNLFMIILTVETDILLSATLALVQMSVPHHGMAVKLAERLDLATFEAVLFHVTTPYRSG